MPPTAIRTASRPPGARKRRRNAIGASCQIPSRLTPARWNDPATAGPPRSGMAYRRPAAARIEAVIRLPSPGGDRLVRLLTRALPFGEGRELPLHDPAPDPGVFGPGSVTWRVMREPLLILGGGRALLLQAAHPLVAQGALDHSSYATDPFGRLNRTIHWVTMVSFGTSAEARTASRTVNR